MKLELASSYLEINQTTLKSQKEFLIVKVVKDKVI